MSIRLGVIGGGVLFRRRVLPVIQNDRDFVLAGVLDKSADALLAVKALAPDVTATDSSDVFFGNALDAVYVATNNAFHAPYSIEALKRGLAVIVEKPIANSVSAAEGMLCAAEQSRRPAMMAYMSKLNAYNQAACNLVRQGRIGEVLSINAGFGWTMDSDNWRLYREHSGLGALGDVGVYPICTILDIFGELPESVSAFAYPYGDPVRTDLTCWGELHFSRGRSAQVRASFVDSFSGYTVIGTTGMIRVDKSWSQDGGGKLTWWNGLKQESVSVVETNPYHAEFQCFKQAIAGQSLPLEMTFARGLEDLRIADALDRSAALRGQTISMRVSR